MTDRGPTTDFRDPEKRNSIGTVILVLIGTAILLAVGYDLYTRNTQSQQESHAVQQATAANAQLQSQLQEAMRRVETNEQRAGTNDQDALLWQTMAKAAVSTVAVRPSTLYSVQHAIFTSADAPTRQMLRDYFKDPANLDKMSPFIVFVAEITQPGPAMRGMLKNCAPLFMDPLPDMKPTNPDALWCYEFLKRRQAEGGDVTAWQKIFASASMAMQPAKK